METWQPVTNLMRRDDALAVAVNRDTWLNYTQMTQWFSLLLDGPTKSIVTTLIQGNDFPGAYYFDWLTRSEYLLWASGARDWRKMRFEVRNEDGETVLGLFARTCEPLSADTQLRALRRPRATIPTAWDALRTLVDESFVLYPLPPLGGPAPDWSAMARQTFADLARPDCRHEVNGARGYHAYVITGEKRGIAQPNLELFVQTDLALSLARYACTAGDFGVKAEADHLRGVLKRFFNSEERFLENFHPPRDFFGPWPEPEDGRRARRVFNNWYQFHNLHKVLAVAERSGDSELAAMGLAVLKTGGELVRRHHYLLPLFADWVNLESCGGGLDLYAVGIYALCLIHAARLDPARRDTYLAEAAEALDTTRRLPPAVYVHEPIALAGCVEAAHALGRREWRDDFLRMLLMMLYRDAPFTGMFQACGALLYPAFKENVETLLPLAEILSDVPPALPLRQIIEHQIRSNVAFFDEREPRGIPFEDIPTIELPGGRGELGKEVYGAGQVFDLACLQRALAGSQGGQADSSGFRGGVPARA